MIIACIWFSSLMHAPIRGLGWGEMETLTLALDRGI